MCDKSAGSNDATKNHLCPKCNAKCLDTHMAVSCDYCDNWYHIGCVKMSKTMYSELTKCTDALQWKCPDCIVSKESKPVKMSDFESLKRELINMFKKLEHMADTQCKTLESLKLDVDVKIVKVNEAVSVNTGNIDKLQQQVSSLENQMQNFHRLNNLSCLNISGIPKSKDSGHDKAVVLNIAKFYGVSLQPNELLFLRRLVNQHSTSIPPIVVRFSSRNIVEDILAKYYAAASPITLANITTENVASRVYINEHLTTLAFKIQRECLKLKKQQILSKVITKKGHVYVSSVANRYGKLTRIDSPEALKKFISSTNNRIQGQRGNSQSTVNDPDSNSSHTAVAASLQVPNGHIELQDIVDTSVIDRMFN